MSKTACIVPWTTLAIGPDGRATFCCDIPAPLTVDGRMGSVYRDSLDDLWNARELVDVRAAMAIAAGSETLPRKHEAFSQVVGILNVGGVERHKFAPNADGPLQHRQRAGRQMR